MTRPPTLVLVAGTGTEIGKTWVAAALATELVGRGVAVAARKPAQSLEPGQGPTDAEVLAAATGERPEEVCQPARTYEVPMAPPMAAAVLGLPVPTIAELVDELRWPAGATVGLVETAGGAASPQADDGDVADLARALAPDVVVVVADAGLGTIHAVRSTLLALAGVPAVVRVHLNRFDPGDDLHRRNRRWLIERDGLDPTTEVASLADTLTDLR